MYYPKQQCIRPIRSFKICCYHVFDYVKACVPLGLAISSQCFKGYGFCAVTFSPSLHFTFPSACFYQENRSGWSICSYFLFTCLVFFARAIAPSTFSVLEIISIRIGPQNINTLLDLKAHSRAYGKSKRSQANQQFA